MRRREILKILLSVLVAIFIMVAAAALLLAGFSEQRPGEAGERRRSGSPGKRTERGAYRGGDRDAFSHASPDGDADPGSHAGGRF